MSRGIHPSAVPRPSQPTLSLFVVALFASCAGPLASLTQGEPLTTSGGPVELRFQPSDQPDAARVEASVKRASAKFSHWGELKTPVLIWLMPDHEALERMVRRHEYAWLRAWAQYDTIYLQTPRTWMKAGEPDGDLDQLLVHEITHSVMYQRCARVDDWAKKDIPVWFREGMATWTAEQGYRFVTLEELARFIETRPEGDPILAPDPLYKSKSEYVYSAAHHAFAFLVQRYGEPRIEALLDAMGTGTQFTAAFQQTIGITEPQFANEFHRYVVWRGFRGSGRPVSAPAAR